MRIHLVLRIYIMPYALCALCIIICVRAAILSTRVRRAFISIYIYIIMYARASYGPHAQCVRAIYYIMEIMGRTAYHVLLVPRV